MPYPTRSLGLGLLALLAAAPPARGQRPGAPHDTAIVRVAGFRFAPATLAVAPGTRVRFENADDIAHTVTFGTPDAPDSRLASGPLARRGDAHEVTTPARGTFAFHCARHPFMTGSLRVTADTTTSSHRSTTMTRSRRAVALATLTLATFAGAAPAVQAQYPAAHAHAGSLRTTLNTLLQEHAYLAAAATGAALGGRTPEFKAAAAALDMNSQAIAGAVGSVYGQDAGTAFLGLWRRHITIVVDYTTAVAKKDKPAADKAVAGLIGYTQDLAAFLSGANPNLPKAAVADLVKSHILTLKDVIDAQAAGDAAKSYGALRTAAAHMQMIADPLADAIGKQFPGKFTD